MIDLESYYKKRYADAENNLAKLVTDLIQTNDLLQCENDNLRKQILKYENLKYIVEDGGDD